MFTGIITDVGTVQLVAKRGDTTLQDRDRLRSGDDRHRRVDRLLGRLPDGRRQGRRRRRRWFSVDASAETLSKTTLGAWTVGTRVNLERSLKVGDEIGGHIVSGHVDGVGEVVQVSRKATRTRIDIRAPKQLAKFIAPRARSRSTAFRSPSTRSTARHFGVNIIPHTSKVTTWGALKPGDKVNIEIDMLARYLARLKEFA